MGVAVSITETSRGEFPVVDSPMDRMKALLLKQRDEIDQMMQKAVLNPETMWPLGSEDAMDRMGKILDQNDAAMALLRGAEQTNRLAKLLMASDKDPEQKRNALVEALRGFNQDANDPVAKARKILGQNADAMAQLRSLLDPTPG
jgi:hypothetical protein